MQNTLFLTIRQFGNQAMNLRNVSNFFILSVQDRRKFSPGLLGLLLAALAATCSAEIKPFASASYQQILDRHAGKAFILAIWSVDCPSCIKDMSVLRDFHQNHPEIDLVLLSTDELAMQGQVEKLLQAQNLDQLENWLFAEDDPQALRYQIDPSWFGELPKTYFFSNSHTRVSKSGALSPQQLLELSQP